MNATYIAIDPGTRQSAFVAFSSPQDIHCFATVDNENLELRLREFCYEWCKPAEKLTGYHHLAIEMVASYGKPVGDEVFQTCLWTGRFIGAFNGPHTLLKRHQIRQHLCHATAGVNDGVIRQRLIDMYGGKEAAIGRKATPGTLYGFKGDEWQALAVAVTWWEKQQAEAA